ncbi:hypothetical protein KM043_006093 [Ampulex compressa]|nr:hypothetical protein KM043_006093 [Ampulex compressa]
MEWTKRGNGERDGEKGEREGRRNPARGFFGRRAARRDEECPGEGTGRGKELCLPAVRPQCALRDITGRSCVRHSHVHTGREERKAILWLLMNDRNEDVCTGGAGSRKDISTAWSTRNKREAQKSRCV